MKRNLQIAGWLLVVMGSVMVTVTLLGLTGVIPLEVEAAGFRLETASQRIGFALTWILAAAAGIGLIMAARRMSGTSNAAR